MLAETPLLSTQMPLVLSQHIKIKFKMKGRHGNWYCELFNISRPLEQVLTISITQLTLGAITDAVFPSPTHIHSAFTDNVECNYHFLAVSWNCMTHH
jgi:hypothetical protein